MQKQRMNRKNPFAAIASFLGLGRLNDNGHVATPGMGYSFAHSEGNAGSYGASIVGTKKYRRYKYKRNKRARAANGGTLPKKFSRA